MRFWGAVCAVAMTVGAHAAAAQPKPPAKQPAPAIRPISVADSSPTAPPIAEIRRVGPKQPFRTIASAAAQARPGDIILVDPGVYKECISVNAPDVLIRGTQPGRVILSAARCEARAIVVGRGDRLVLDGLTFAHSRLVDGDTVGVRFEARDLMVRRSVFFRNGAGLVSTPNPDSTITVEDSRFEENGECSGACGPAIDAGRARKLVVRRTEFRNAIEAQHIRSRAAETEITEAVVDDGPMGTAPYLLDLPDGGSLILRGSLFIKGENSANMASAIRVGADAPRATPALLLIENNRFINRMRLPTVFFWNDTQTQAILRNNQFEGLVLPSRGRRGR
jgi:hypothetical protein